MAQTSPSTQARNVFTAISGSSGPEISEGMKIDSQIHTCICNGGSYLRIRALVNYESLIQIGVIEMRSGQGLVKVSIQRSG
jgi:hypothetical protein